MSEKEKAILLKLDSELWNKFYSRYQKNSLARLRQLIAKDIMENSLS